MNLSTLNPLKQFRRLIRNQEKVDRDLTLLRGEVQQLRSELAQERQTGREADRQARDAVLTISFQHALAQSAMTRRALGFDAARGASTHYAPASPKSFEQYLKDLEALDRKNYPTWRELFANGERSYRDEREASCSLWGNAFAEAFRSFIMLTAHGRLLDIGSGPYGLPMYLEGYPKDLISGVEPLEPVDAPDFELVKGFCEFLPWPNGAFDTIVSGTSMDHVLSLEKALDEIDRVLAPDGNLVLWIASIAGAKEYRPQDGKVAAIDQFHMFHFHESWLEPMLKKKFVLHERMSFPTPSFDHIFYSFKKSV